MTTILAIDPGSSQSAWIRYDGSVGQFAIEENDALRKRIWTLVTGWVDAVVIEWMTPRGMPTSAQEFETVWWAGRFTEAAQPLPVHRLSRLVVKKHLCGNPAANDANIRASLIDRFGGIGGKAAAIGVKAMPGPLHGIANDVWAALAVAVTFHDQEEANR